MSEEPDEFNIDDEFPEEEQAEEGSEMEQDDPIDDQEDASDRLDDLEEKTGYLQDQLDLVPALLGDAFDPVFPANLTAFTSGTGGAWKEQFSSGTALTNYVSGRFTSAATNPAAMFGPAETGFLSVEQVTPGAARFPAFFPGIIDCYLTKVGATSIGYTYDGYLDASKTIKIFAAQTSLVPSTLLGTRGLARLVGKIWRFISPVGSGANAGGVFLASCFQNGSDGAGPTYDCFDTETGATKLNLLGPLPPTCSRVRLNGSITPIAAGPGDLGIVAYIAEGVLILFDLPETVCAVAFVFGVS